MGPRPFREPTPSEGNTVSGVFNQTGYNTCFRLSGNALSFILAGPRTRLVGDLGEELDAHKADLLFLVVGAEGHFRLIDRVGLCFFFKIVVDVLYLVLVDGLLDVVVDVKAGPGGHDGFYLIQNL